MDTLKDLLASLVAGIRDRTTNPLTVAFVISWSLWNFKFFIVLFGDGTAAERISAIEALFPNEKATYLGNALLYPIVTTLIYVFIYPVVSLAAIGAYRTYQVWTANLVKRVEKNRVLTQAEAIELTRRHEIERIKWEEKSASHSQEVAGLRLALRGAEEQAAKPLEAPAETTDAVRPQSEAIHGLVPPKFTANSLLPQTNDSIEKDDGLTKSERVLVLHLSNYPGAVRAKTISDAINANFSLVEADLKSLEKKGLVMKKTAERYSSTPIWSLSEKGKTLAVSMLQK